MAAKKFTRAALLAHPEFRKYQKDFLAAVLREENYTLAAARKIVKEFFEKGV